MPANEKDELLCENDTNVADGKAIDINSVPEGMKADTEQVDSRIRPLEEKVSKLTAEVENQKDMYLRLAAEYDNYRRRTERDRLLIYSDATANAIKNILPIADALDAAVKSFDNAPAEYKKGISLLASHLDKSFEKLEITSFGAEGDIFDPNEFEAIQHIDDPNLGENVVVEVLRKGYKIKDKVIRVAVVRVAN